MQLENNQQSLSEKEIRELLEPYHPDPYLFQPRSEDFPDIYSWQKAYDQWYKHQSLGHCENFAGHF